MICAIGLLLRMRCWHSQGLVFLTLTLLPQSTSFRPTKLKLRQCVEFSCNKLFVSPANTILPKGLNPFEKGVSKSLDIGGSFRKLAEAAIDQAIADGLDKLEIEFPPLSDSGKTQFDDFDNVQELNANRDWCVQLIPLLKRAKVTWFVLPDDKECELASQEWTGQIYRKDTRFTSLRAACEAVSGVDNSVYRKAWGSRLVETMNKMQGGDGILADSSTLDFLDMKSNARFHLICQPGNGGPVEDWINVERFHSESVKENARVTSCVVNGALDKVSLQFVVLFALLSSLYQTSEQRLRT